MSGVLLDVLEAFEVEGEDDGEFLDAHPLLGLLITAAVVALELVVPRQHLRVGKAAEAVRDARVLVNVNLQVEKVLVLAAHHLAVQTTCLARQNPLENLVHPRRFTAPPTLKVTTTCTPDARTRRTRRFAPLRSHSLPLGYKTKIPGMSNEHKVNMPRNSS